MTMTDNALKISEGANMDSLTIIKDELEWLNKLNTEQTIFGMEYAVDEEKERLSKALSLAVDGLEELKEDAEGGYKIYIREMQKSIAKILSGGGGGK